MLMFPTSLLLYLLVERARYGQTLSHHGLGTCLLVSTRGPDVQGMQSCLTDLIET